MKAMIYTRHGGPEVLQAAQLPVPEPGPGEVRVRVRYSGVNPTDWKSRSTARALPDPERGQVPDQDGSGVVDAVGEGVPEERIGQRVWLWEAAHERADGTAQEYVALPARLAVPLPDSASYETGAGLGVPALTAHRALTLAEGGPTRLAPGALAGRTVLVQGGAGAVGNAAIQLARWAGATVVATVSGPAKAALATAAGAHRTVNYREGDPARAILAVAPDGVDIVVEVAPAANAELDLAVTANGGVIAYYANNGGDTFTLPVRASFSRNLRWQGLLLYTLSRAAKEDGVAAVTAALADGALAIGEEKGLPVHRYPLERTADAHRAVEEAAVGKVLVEVAEF